MNLGQWPQELEASLDNMRATNQAFLGRFDLDEGPTRLVSAQGVVAFATCRVTKQQVRSAKLRIASSTGDSTVKCSRWRSWRMLPQRVLDAPKRRRLLL
jgi:hypothetical protein